MTIKMNVKWKNIRNIALTIVIMSMALISAINWGLNKAQEGAIAKAKAQIIWEYKVQECLGETGLVPDLNCLVGT